MRKMKRNVLSLALAMGLSSGAFAATQTLVGSHVTFTFDDALLSLFGKPAVSGDTIYFTPTSFTAESFNGAGVDMTRATLNIGITANAGYTLNSLGLTERGDYWLYSPLTPTGLGAEVSGQIRVFDTTAPLVDMVAGIKPTAPLTTVADHSIDWTANAGVSFASWQAQSINLTIENLL